MSNEDSIKEQSRTVARLEDWNRRRLAHVEETRRLNDEFRQLVGEAREAGLAVTEVARLLGWSRQSIYERLSRPQ